MNFKYYVNIFLKLNLIFYLTNLYCFDLYTFFSFNTLFKQYLQSRFNSDNPYKNEIATVRVGSNLAPQELDFLNKRIAINNEALNNLLNLDQQNKNLNIAFCASGGGYRAAICTLGSLIGAQDIGLLNCVTYMSGLSGSTWAMSLWLSSGIDLNTIKEQLIKNFSNNIELIQDRGFPNIEEEYFPDVIENLLTKYIFNQSLCSADIWGALISSDLFKPIEKCYQLKLSDQMEMLKYGNFPLPIYTSIHPTSKLNYNWLEFTPYEVGNIENNSYIPAWSFGRKFENGKSIDNAPEQSLSFLLGVFGSAYDVTPEELVTKMDLKGQFKDYLKTKLSFIPKIILSKLIDIEHCVESLLSKNIDCSQYHDYRFLPGQTCNFNYKLQNMVCNDQTNMVLVDAGIDFNLPFPPLLKPERNVDIIFALDSSEIVKDGIELVGAQNYANKKGLKFPIINNQGIENNSFTVFGLEEYPNKPIVIYMPRVNPIVHLNDEQILDLKNKVDNKYHSSIDKLRSFDIEDCVDRKYCSTFNFAYEKEETTLLSDMTYMNMIINKEKIIEVLKTLLNKKYQS